MPGSGTAAVGVEKFAEYAFVREPAEVKFANTVWYGSLNWKVKIICNGVAVAKPGPSDACLANPCAVIVPDD